MKNALVAVIILMLSSTAAFAADINADNLEMVLLPFAFRENLDQINGAFGTIWTGQVWLENRNEVAVPLHELCPAMCVGMDPHTAGRLMGTPLGVNAAEHGLLMFIPAHQADNVTWSNRIFERTLRAQPRGVDIPVVREGEFFDRPQTFLGVPGSNDVRVSVRAYNPWQYQHFPPSALPGPPLEYITVEVRDEHQRMLGAAQLRPRVAHPTTAGEDWHKPGFDAIYDLAAAIPAIAAHSYVHVRVAPFPAGAQYWAMVAITDNETQTVSIITAQ